MKRYIVIVAFALAGFFAVKLAYEHFRDPAKAEEVGRLKGQLHQDSLNSKAQISALLAASAKVDTVRVAFTNTVTRWQKEIVHDTVQLPPTATPHDTIVATQTKLNACKDVGSEVVGSAIPLGSSCAALQAQAKLTIGSLEKKYSDLESLYNAPKPSKHWNLSVSVGFGYASPLDSLAPKRQASIGVTVGRTLLSW